MVSYATAAELATRWRPLTASEQAQATALLGDASQLLRRRLAARGVDLDAQIASGALDAVDALIVVVGMVRRAMQVGAEGVSQVSQTAGPFALAQTFANPQGNLYVTEQELNDLTPVAFRRAFRSVRMEGL